MFRTVICTLALAVLFVGNPTAAKADAIGGPKTFNGYVDAQYDKTDSGFIEFKGGREARIVVHNLSNRGNIDLFVYDLDGRLVASDRRSDDDAKVVFYPAKSSEYRVVIKAKAGDRPLRYQMKTN